MRSLRQVARVPGLRADDDRKAEVAAAGRVPVLRDVIDDRIHADRDEVDARDLRDRMHARDGRPERRREDAGLGDRSREIAILAELLDQTLARALELLDRDVLRDRED